MNSVLRGTLLECALACPMLFRERIAAAASASPRPAARLNQRPKCRTVSTQPCAFKPNRSKIGES